MTVTSPKQVAEKIENAARPCISGLPYRAIVFIRTNGKVPLYSVAGQQGGPWGADKALRKAFAIHGGTCFYCNKGLKADAMTVDHVEPQKLNGGESVQNLVLACKPCNSAKAHIPIEAFKPNAGKAWLEALLKQVEERLRKLD